MCVCVCVCTLFMWIASNTGRARNPVTQTKSLYSS